MLTERIFLNIKWAVFGSVRMNALLNSNIVIVHTKIASVDLTALTQEHVKFLINHCVLNLLYCMYLKELICS